MSKQASMSFHQLVHSTAPKGQEELGQTKAKSQELNAALPLSGSSLLSPMVCTSRNLELGAQLGTDFKHCNMGHGHLNHENKSVGVLRNFLAYSSKFLSL